MRKWRYRTITAKAATENGSRLTVTSIDGNASAPIIKKKSHLLDSDQRVLLSTYLDSVGEEGWEVCGMSPLEGGGEYPAPIGVLILLKKLTTDE